VVAGLAIVVHSIIPHDHHIACPDIGPQESCPLSQQKSEHQPFFPVHCHAFNDLAAEKFSPVIIKQKAHASFASVIWSADNILPGPQLSLAIIGNSRKSFPDIYIPDFSPFRAPPSLG